MKKREKFLICFVISWCIVMIFYLLNGVYNAKVMVNQVKMMLNWVDKYGSWDWKYDNLTEEAKKYFEDLIKENDISEQEFKEYCIDNPNEDICDEHKSKIMEKVFLIAHQSDVDDEAFHAYTLVLTLFEATVSILLLTIIFYSIIIIELKNKKQYLIDIVKLLLKIIILFVLCIAFSYLLEYSIGTYALYGDSWTNEEKLEWFWVDIKVRFENVIITYMIILIPNLIINLIKNIMTKKRQIKKNKEK